mgnify:CR=1 FL=1
MVNNLAKNMLKWGQKIQKKTGGQKDETKAVSERNSGKSNFKK